MIGWSARWSDVRWRISTRPEEKATAKRCCAFAGCAPTFFATSRSTCAKAKSWGFADWSDPVGPRSPRAIFGADRRDAGEVWIDGEALHDPTPRKAIEAGLGFVTEERKVDGLALDSDVVDNASLAAFNRISRGPLLNRRRQREMVFETVRALDLRPLDLSFILRRMSGGNQQKVVLAKWLLVKGLRVLILDEPTRGVDIATKVEIYRLIADLAARGVGVILISSEMPEVLGLAHRICVMNSGGVAAEFDPETTSEHEIFVAASSVRREAA